MFCVPHEPYLLLLRDRKREKQRDTAANYSNGLAFRLL